MTRPDLRAKPMVILVPVAAKTRYDSVLLIDANTCNDDDTGKPRDV